jgi:SAM-dependent methyltransferase
MRGLQWHCVMGSRLRGNDSVGIEPSTQKSDESSVISRAWQRTLLALVAACWLSIVPTRAADYTPEVGQQGKDVVWVPTALTLVNKMLDMAKLTPQDILYDLGSGDGRTVITAAKRGTRAYGIEYNPEMVALSKRNALKEGVAERATFEQADIFQTDFSKATVITLFLLPELNVKLRPTILDMKPGTRVAANSFDMGDWKPDQIARVSGDCQSWCTAFLWIVPAKVAGTWKFAQPGNGELTLTQHYQTLSGTLSQNGKSRAISLAKLDGDRISFYVAGTQYRARVSGSGDTMEGTAGAAKSPWRASRVSHITAGQ